MKDQSIEEYFRNRDAQRQREVEALRKTVKASFANMQDALNSGFLAQKLRKAQSDEEVAAVFNDANASRDQELQDAVQRGQKAQYEQIQKEAAERLARDIAECAKSGKWVAGDIDLKIKAYAKLYEHQLQDFMSGIFKEENSSNISQMIEDFSDTSNKEFKEFAETLLTNLDKISNNKVKQNICDAINENAGFATILCKFCLTHTGLGVVASSIFSKEVVDFTRILINAENSLRQAHSEASGTLAAAGGREPQQMGK